MMIRHGVVALVIFSMLITLWVNIYQEGEESYDLVRNATDENGTNIIEKMESLNFVEGVNDITTAIYDLAAPTGIIDILGGLAAAGIGILKSIGGIATAPVEVFGVLTGYYYIPPIIPIMIPIIVMIYVAFLILSAYLNRDI